MAKPGAWIRPEFLQVGHGADLKNYERPVVRSTPGPRMPFPVPGSTVVPLLIGGRRCRLSLSYRFFLERWKPRKMLCSQRLFGPSSADWIAVAGGGSGVLVVTVRGFDEERSEPSFRDGQVVD